MGGLHLAVFGLAPFALLFWAAWKRPAWVPAFLMLGVSADILVSAGGFHVYDNEWALAGAFAGAFVSPGRDRLWASVPPWMKWSFLPLALVIALHALWPGPLGASAKDLLRASELWLGMAFLFALDEGQAEGTLKAFLAATAAFSAYGVAQTLAGPGSWINQGRQWEVFYGHIQAANSVFQHHNQFSAFLTAALPGCAAALGFKRLRAWALAALGLGLAGLACTFSRGSWVGLVAGLALFSWALPRRWRLGLLLCVAAGLALAYGLGDRAVKSRLFSILKVEDQTDRITLTRLGFKIWEGKWLWGRGAGVVHRELPGLVDDTVQSVRLRTMFSSHLHDFWLQESVELGLVGLLAWLAFFLAPWTLGWRRLWAGRGSPDPRLWWCLALCVALTSFGVQSLTDLLLLHDRGLGLGLWWALEARLAELGGPARPASSGAEGDQGTPQNL